jgi:hypothetical protein
VGVAKASSRRTADLACQKFDRSHGDLDTVRMYQNKTTLQIRRPRQAALATLFLVMLAVVDVLTASPVLAAPPTSASPTTNANKSTDFVEQPIDGVKMEALETYRNPRSSQFEVGVSLWPLNPYYNGLGVDIGYVRVFDKTSSWEIVHGSYIYTVDKGLASELAENYKVAPSQIERLNYVISSNYEYTFAYGKMILLKEHFRYFRSQFLVGPALAITNKNANIGLQIGWGIEAYVNELFSWKIELRDTIANAGDSSNNLAFQVSTSYGF